MDWSGEFGRLKPTDWNRVWRREKERGRSVRGGSCSGKGRGCEGKKREKATFSGARYATTVNLQGTRCGIRYSVVRKE